MTEEEAKAKWCPFASTIVADARQQTAAHNRSALDHQGRQEFVNSPAYALCIGSACMAWRWEAQAREDRGRAYIDAIKNYRDEHRCDLATAKHAVDAAWVAPSPTRGFCGLAGSPA